MRPALVLLALVTALPAAASADGAPSAAGTVTVHRGSVSTAPSPIPVYRGGSAARPVPRAAAEPAAPRIAVVGGRQVWFVDSGTNRLTGCRVIQTSTVGQQFLRCTSGRLPGR
jgi:hypothetical protein